MSLLGKYFKGWRFRTSRPAFKQGSEVDVFIAESNGTSGRAYIGDTELVIEGAGPDCVEKQVRVRITEFDEAAASGRGEFVEVVGESSYDA
ncbi:TRAM domain-containing protein [Natrinema versiforme]|uniref:TRAM domain-containing protein n=1 Tax=Natrinema versiforme TaxID=88724 RepID=A0A4V1FZM0_9EURY|nr:TRAM domain-containing protein [Natrinema versiforme]QCS42316.1 TRAM domain-containing protein [Natrinema versiforme]